MQTTFESTRDDFDRWIRWALAVNSQNVRPPDQVWQRIVRHIVSSGRASNRARRKGDQPFDVVVGVGRF